MVKATNSDKQLVLNILTASFKTNLSVNYIIKKDNKQTKRIRALMDYSFEICQKFGDVLISRDRYACALILYPDRKKTTLQTILLDLELIFKCVGFQNIKKTLKRESLIKKARPKAAVTYLWFIGVAPEKQGYGIGSRLLTEIIENSRRKNRPVYLETSTLMNLPWYQKFGFRVYHEENIDYKLYFLNNQPD
jgi:GNAT superfamily N-acetyltransferase